MILPRLRLFTTVALASAALFSCLESSFPATVNWGGLTNGSISGSWTNTLNWGGATASANTLNFAGTNQLVTTNDYAAGTTFTGLAFAAGAGAFTLNGTNIILGGNIDNNGTNATVQTINLNIALSAKSQFNANSSSVILINGKISDNTTAQNITVNNGATDTGTVILTGSNSYSGTTTLKSGGVLRIANDYALGTTTGGTVVTLGALELSNNINVGAEALSIAGAGVGNTGAVRNIHGTNSYGGLVTLTAAATVEADANTALTLSGGMTGNFAKTFDGAGNITSSGVVAGSGGVNKTGTGTLTLSAANTYTGNLTISNGAVRGISNASAFGGITSLVLAGGNLEMANDTALNYAEALVVSNNSTIVSDRLTSGAGVTHSNNTLSIGAQTLSIAAGSKVTSGTAGVAFSGTTTLRATGAIFDVATGAQLTLGAVGGGTFGFTVTGAGNTTIGGVIGTTSGTVAKDGTGTLTLTAANTYTGATTISNGTVNIQNNAGLGATNGGTTVLSGGALELQNNTTVGAEALSLSGTGVGGAGALRNVGGNNTYQGTITNTSAARINSDSGTLTLSGAINATNQLLTFGGAGNITVSGAITNSTNGLTKDGNGQLTLSATNTYTGTTTVSAGTLAYGVSNAISSGAVTVSGGTLSMGTFSDTVGAVTLTSGTISGSTGVLTGSSYTVESGSISAILGGSSVALTKDTAGTVTLSGSNTYTGLTAINAGTLAIASSAAVTNSSGINLGNTAALEYTGGTGTVDRSISVTNGTGTIRNTGAGTLTLSGALSKNGTVLRFNTGTFNVTGVISGASANSDLVVDSATVTLSNTNTYNGPTFIRNAGTLVANVVGAMPTNTRSAVTMDDSGTGSSALTIAANQQIASLTGAASSTASIATNTSLTLGTSATNTTFAGVISGGGRLVKDGASTQTLTGANTYSGGTLVSAGVLAGNASGLQGNITNNATVAFTQTSSGTYAGTMSGTGALTKDGTGLLTLSSSNSYSGGTTLREGELHVNSAGGLGTGIVSLTGTNPVSLAALHYSNTVSPLTVGALTLNGNSEIALQALARISSTGALTINSTNNFIAIGGSNWNLGTNTLVSGTSLTINGGASILLTGTTLNNGTLGLGSTTNIGRSSFTFGSNATSFYLTTAGVAFDVLWSGAQNNLWNTNATNWQQTTNGLNPSGTNIAFATDDNVYFGNTATNAAITVDTGGVQAAQMYVTNSAGTVTFNGASLAAHNLFKSGSGDLTISNSLQLIGDDAAGPNVGVFSNTGSGNVLLAGVFSEGSLVHGGSGTLTLSASNTYGGTTTIAGGVLAANNLANAGSASSIGTGATVAITNNGVFRYTGASVSTDRGINLTGNGGIGVSNSAAALTISGVISNTGSLSKYGAGTLLLSGANTFTGSTTVSSGTLNLSNATGSALGSTTGVSVASGAKLLVSQSNQVNNSAAVTLSGGTITRASGVSEVFGSLDLTSNSFLDFGSGTAGNMTFGTYEGNTTPSALLTVNDFFGGNTLVFGSDLSSYISASYTGTSFTSTYFNINSISGGFTSSWNGSTFTITAIPEPSTYVAAAGLIGLMLWPSRRRILRYAKRTLGLRPPTRDRLAALHTR